MSGFEIILTRMARRMPPILAGSFWLACAMAAPFLFLQSEDSSALAKVAKEPWKFLLNSWQFLLIGLPFFVWASECFANHFQLRRVKNTPDRSTSDKLGTSEEILRSP